MKKIYSTFLYLAALIAVASCQKGSPAQPAFSAMVNFSYSGFAIKDTFEMVLDDKVIETFYPNEGFRYSQLIGMESGSRSIGLRKKGASNTIGTVTLKDAPREQERKFYFEGDVLKERPVVEPASDPSHFGYRIALNAKAPIYNGNVDVYIYEWKTRRRPAPAINVYTEIKVIRNVSAAMSEHFDLPNFIPETGFSKLYVCQVYKAGTKEPPFIEGTDLSALGMDYKLFYGQWSYETPGETQYIMLGPNNYNGKFYSFSVNSITDYF